MEKGSISLFCVKNDCNLNKMNGIMRFGILKILLDTSSESGLTTPLGTRDVLFIWELAFTNF